MDLVIDFLLLATSGAACLYCIVLSNKLKSLTNMRAGLGAGITALCQSTDEVKAVMEKARAEADASSSRLEGLIREAQAQARELKSLAGELETMGRSVVDHADGATRNYVAMLSPMLQEANTAADNLLAAIAAAPAPDTGEKNNVARLKPRSDAKAATKNAGKPARRPAKRAGAAA